VHELIFVYSFLLERILESMLGSRMRLYSKT